MLEALAVMVGDAVVAYEATGRVPRPAGNRHPRLAPHGIYPAQNGDWIAVSVETEVAWQAPATHIGLAREPHRFDDTAKRTKTRRRRARRVV